MFLNAKVIILFLFMVNGTFLYAEVGQKRYDVKSGVIKYVINGGGALTPETNLTIRGEGKLRFRDWGRVELFEEAVEEVTSGAIKNIETTQVCKKISHDRKLDVDFKNKKILERSIVRGEKKTVLKGLLHKGQDKIAGYTCDVWEGEGIRKCIYKGIPLLIEYSVLGMSYQKKAVSATFDIKTSLDQCTIPSYPIQKFALFKSTIKTKSKMLPKVFSQRLLEISKELQKELKDNNITEADLPLQRRKLWLEKIGDNIFQKQKKLLPKILLSMKKTRVCLQQTNNRIDANSCLKEVSDIKSQFTKDVRDNVGSWKGEEKTKILNEFDTNISLLESKMQCIRSAKNITDLSSCMKK
ncbi:hypothetical protein [Sulfurovum sp.]|uniref:hypothetical protein n=1 Tax=Sulfurovum sp. TaxID=1969726 RepID=UPI0025F2EFC1|nr:hypothetical protein [Sulfurovum sp.]